MKLSHAVTIAALLIALPVSSHAAGTRPWFSGTLGASSYAMDDVNREVQAINSVLAEAGLKMDEINSGLSFALSAGLDVGSGWSVGAGYERLAASTDVGDASGSLEYTMPANLLRAFGRYTFPSARQSKVFLEMSLGRVATAGSVTLSETGGPSNSAELEGSGLLYEVAVGADVWTAPQFALTGSLGYRMAEAKDVTSDGNRVYGPGGSDYTIDYSGLTVRLGLTVAFTP